MDLNKMLEKMNDLKKKEKIAKKIEKEETTYNLKKNYEEAKERLENKIEETDLATILKIFKKIEKLPGRWSVYPDGYDMPVEFRGKPLFKMLCAPNNRHFADANNKKIAFHVNGEGLNDVRNTSLVYRRSEGQGTPDMCDYMAYLSVEDDDIKMKYAQSNGISEWPLGSGYERDMFHITRLMNDFCDSIDDFVEEATFALSEYMNDMSKQIDVIIDENEDYRLIQCANGSMEIRDYDDELVAETEYDNLEDALEELQNENDLQI